MGRGLIKIENLIARIGEFFFERGNIKTFIARMKKTISILKTRIPKEAIDKIVSLHIFYLYYSI